MTHQTRIAKKQIRRILLKKEAYFTRLSLMVTWNLAGTWKSTRPKPPSQNSSQIINWIWVVWIQTVQYFCFHYDYPDQALTSLYLGLLPQSLLRFLTLFSSLYVGSIQYFICQPWCYLISSCDITQFHASELLVNLPRPSPHHLSTI